MKMFFKQQKNTLNFAIVSWKYLTNNRLYSITFSQDDIAKIIQNLDSGKAHGHDNISINMLKIYGSAIYKPLAIILNNGLIQVFSLLSGKRVILFIFIKKATNKHWKIIVQYRYSLFAEKFLSDQSLMKCSIFLLKMNLSRQTGLVLN